VPAVTVDNLLSLPRIAPPDPAADRPRPVARVLPARFAVEGAGFSVWRPFPGGVDLHLTDPFLLLDQGGPVDNAPGEAKGAPWHPHRGFETVTYVLDGEVAHHDSNGGGGVIGEGDTQWMTAGAGILHDEVPTERLLRAGGRSHIVQLWVNLPAALKFSPPRYQPITASALTLLSSDDGGALVRLIAGDLAGHAGPGSTSTPITYAHASVHAGARLTLPWNASFNALAYVLDGEGFAGHEGRPVGAHDLVVFGPGDSITLRAADRQPRGGEHLEVLLLGGLPIREPIAHYGPFVMNTRAEILEAIDDFQAGRMGTIPAVEIRPEVAPPSVDAPRLSVTVDATGRLDPGAVAVLLDHLRHTGLRATWLLPDGADAALADRLAFEGHSTADAASRSGADGPALGDDPHSWHRASQTAVGRALERDEAFELRIDAAALDRADAFTVVAETLDLVAGLVRAGRLDAGS
jgi:redox-sensitive bicupin YhaK (pirin superfamily)